MIRNFLLSTVALAAISGSAFAADLPSRRPPPVYIPPPIPIFSWTGFYIGADVGAAFGKNTANIAGFSLQEGQHNGVIGGGHIGYNLSSQSFPLLGGFGGSGGVIGIEADFTGSEYRGTVGSDGFGNPGIQTKSEVQGSVRGRVGIAVDRALFFVTGGAAVAEFKDQYLSVFNTSHDRIGYTVGGGVEYALTTNWSLRAEYRYSDFGTFRDNVANIVTVSQRNIMQRATVGVSYKFDSPVLAPVVARY